MFLHLPKQMSILSFVSRKQLRHKEKEEGFPQGGNLGSPLWLRAEGTHRIKLSVHKNKPATHQSYNQNFFIF